MSDVNHTDKDCKVIGCQMCSIRKQNSNWTHGTCVKCGEAFLFWKDATGKRCNECEKEGIQYPEPTSSIEYKNLFTKYQDLKANHERVLQMLEIAEAYLKKDSKSEKDFASRYVQGNKVIDVLVDMPATDALAKIESLK